jgi:hypothetical protein
VKRITPTEAIRALDAAGVKLSPAEASAVTAA